VSDNVLAAAVAEVAQPRQSRSSWFWGAGTLQAPVARMVKTRPRIKNDRRVGQRRQARIDRRQADMERRLDDMRRELDVQFKRIVDIQLAIDRLEALQK